MGNHPITNPTAALSLDDFVATLPPAHLTKLSSDEKEAVISRAEQRARDLAQRLGVDAKSGRLPIYVWVIAFEAV